MFYENVSKEAEAKTKNKKREESKRNQNILLYFMLMTTIKMKFITQKQQKIFSAKSIWKQLIVL